MDIFLSWSGKKSKLIAEALQDWLPVVIQSIRPFFSDQSIESGERWSDRLSNELSATNFGIICLTEDNLEAPWVQFEAGALSKLSTKANVATLLFDVNPSDLTKNPLNQFQGDPPTKEGIYKLLESINCKLEIPLSPQVLSISFERNWHELEKSFNEIHKKTNTKAKNSEPTQKELMNYLLDKQEMMHDDIRSLLGTPRSHGNAYSKTEKRLLQAIENGHRDFAHDLVNQLLHAKETHRIRIPKTTYITSKGKFIHSKELLSDDESIVYCYD